MLWWGSHGAGFLFEGRGRAVPPVTRPPRAGLPPAFSPAPSALTKGPTLAVRVSVCPRACVPGANVASWGHTHAWVCPCGRHQPGAVCTLVQPLRVLQRCRVGVCESPECAEGQGRSSLLWEGPPLDKDALSWGPGWGQAFRVKVRKGSGPSL